MSPNLLAATRIGFFPARGAAAGTYLTMVPSTEECTYESEVRIASTLLTAAIESPIPGSTPLRLYLLPFGWSSIITCSHSRDGPCIDSPAEQPRGFRGELDRTCRVSQRLTASYGSVRQDSGPARSSNDKESPRTRPASAGLRDFRFSRRVQHRDCS